MRGDEMARLQEHPFPEDVTDTSRLACQVTVTADMHGMVRVRETVRVSVLL